MLFDKKVDKVEGKELSSNDFTNEYKEKLEGLHQVDISGLLPKGGYEGTGRELKDAIDKKIDKEIFGFALEVTDNTILSKEHAGRVLRCNNDIDINLDFSTFPDNALLSVVKGGSANIIFTGKTLVGNSSITGAKGSTASLVVCGTEVISNVNNKQ